MELSGPSRRELIAAFLGAAVAQGCRSSAPVLRTDVPGECVDRVVEAGHRLRSTAPPPRAEALEPVDVLVVGGGVAGLSAAWRLRGAGLRSVVLCELDAELGGTARSGESAISKFPWGAHYLPAPLTAKGPVARLLRETGVLAGVSDDGSPEFLEEALVADAEERLFYRGHWYEGLYLRAGASADDLSELASFERQMAQFAAARDAKGRKAFSVPVATSSDDAEWVALDRVSFADWFEAQGYRSPRLRWWIEYACRDDYGAQAAQVSAWAGIWYFASRSDGARRHEGLLSWPEGNGHLVHALGKGLERRQVRRSVLIHHLAAEGGHCAAHGWDTIAGRPVGFRARQVILACPQFIAARVLRGPEEPLAPHVQAFEYSPWLVANVRLTDAPPSRGFPLAWDNVPYESRSLGYVSALHQAPRVFARGPMVLTWYYPFDGADVRAERTRLLSASVEEWKALVLADLRAAHPGVDPLVERIDVMRWGHAMVRPRPGFIWGTARAAAAVSPLRGVHLAHSDLGGMGLFEEANWFGVQAAEHALRELGTQGTSWLHEEVRAG